MKTIKTIACIISSLFLVTACSNNSAPNSLAGNPTPDLIVTDIEVSQGTQNLANDMPLVANRWTLVRVLVEDKNEAGAENVTARLIGFRLCPGPGCPPNFNGPIPLPILSPWNSGGGRIAVKKEGGSRTNLDDGFWFFLPKSWRELPGSIQIVAEINHDGAAPETLNNNNTKTTTATFNAADMLRVRAVPLHLHQGWNKDNPEVIYDCSEGDFWDIFLNMFRYHPIDRFLVSCPSEALEPFPHVIVPKEIAPFEWDMSDPEICGDANTRLKWLKAQENLQGRWQYAGLIHPSLGSLCNGWSGAANGDAVWLRMSSGVGSDPWVIGGGVTLAHELGHSHLPNPDHILCKGNEGPPNGSADTNYPFLFPNCRFSAANAKGYYGLDVYYALWPGTAASPTVLPNGSPNAIVSDPDLFPLMGYLSPRWTDPYTYCQLLNSYVLSELFFCDRDDIDPNPDINIESGKLSKASIPAESKLLSAAEWVLVSGKINLQNPSLSTLNQISRQVAGDFFSHVRDEALKNFGIKPPPDLAAVFNSRSETPLALPSTPCRSSSTKITTRSPSRRTALSNCCPSREALKPLPWSIRKTTRSSTPRPPARIYPLCLSQARRRARPSTPARSSLGRADGDGDFLYYTLRYSPNGGNDWHVILLDTADTTHTANATFSIAGIPGSTAGLLELVVNDGFNSSTTRFNGTVVAPGHPPQIAIQGGVQDRILNRSSPLILAAMVSDPEDGAMTNPDSLTWTSDLSSALLGKGEELILRAGDLVAGTHRITLSAVDSEGMASAQSLTVVVSP